MTSTDTENQVLAAWTATHIAARTLPLEARVHVVARLSDWGILRVPGLLDNAELIMSELVTNAVTETPEGKIKIEIRRTALTVDIAVWDSSNVMPVSIGMPAVDLDSEAFGDGGWGLAMVTEISEKCGYEATEGGGKWVWAKLSAPIRHM